MGAIFFPLFNLCKIKKRGGNREKEGGRGKERGREKLCPQNRKT